MNLKDIIHQNLQETNWKGLYLLKETELTINNPPKQKAQSPDGFTDELCQMFNKITPILYNFLQKVETKRTIPSSFYEASRISKSKTLQKRKITDQCFINLDTRIPDKRLTN